MVDRILSKVKNYCEFLIKQSKIWEFMFIFIFWLFHIASLSIAMGIKGYPLILVAKISSQMGVVEITDIKEIWIIVELLSMYLLFVFRPNMIKSFVLFVYFVYSSVISLSIIKNIDKVVDYVYKDFLVGVMKVYTIEEKVERLHYLLNEKLRIEGFNILTPEQLSEIKISGDIRNVFYLDLEKVVEVYYKELKPILINSKSIGDKAEENVNGCYEVMNSVWNVIISPAGATVIIIGVLLIGGYIGYQWFQVKVEDVGSIEIPRSWYGADVDVDKNYPSWEKINKLADNLTEKITSYHRSYIDNFIEGGKNETVYKFIKLLDKLHMQLGELFENGSYSEQTLKKVLLSQKEMIQNFATDYPSADIEFLHELIDFINGIL